MLCAMSGRMNKTGFSRYPHLPCCYAAMTPACVAAPLVAVGCVVFLELCAYNPAGEGTLLLG